MFNENRIRKSYSVWDDLEGKTGTFHVGRDWHDGIETKIVIFHSEGVNYVLAEYRKKVTKESYLYGLHE